MPAFYLRPQSIAEIVDHTVARVLDHLGVEQTLVPEWSGAPPRRDPAS
jgi:4-hydroxy-3-polyprenylbenzoate decarboxylase